jgi:ParB/RepB/Spo0J family partition protein
VPLRYIPIAAIFLSGENMRIEATEVDELAESIRQIGLLEPLVVEQAGKASFRLICGHRRLAASREAGLKKVPCMVREFDSTAGRLTAMLAENVHREHLSPIEEGRACQRLVDEGLTQTEVAYLLGKTDFYVSTRISFLSLSKAMQTKLHRGEMTMAEANEHVRAERARERGKDRASRPPQARFTIMYADKLIRILEGGSVPLHDKDVAKRLERLRQALNALTSEDEATGEIRVQKRRCKDPDCITLLSKSNDGEELRGPPEARVRMTLDTLSIGCSLVQWKGEKGRCNWCDKELTGRQTRWCSRDCTEAYSVNHWWSYASRAAKDRDGHRCKKCGRGPAPTARLEVHHVVAAEGKHSTASCIHHLENLETLCRPCHLEEERTKREQARNLASHPRLDLETADA